VCPSTCVRVVVWWWGQEAADVALEVGRSLLDVRGELGGVHHHQSQVSLLHPGDTERFSIINNNNFRELQRAI